MQCSRNCYSPAFKDDEEGKNPLRELYDEYLHKVSEGHFEKKFYPEDSGVKYSDTVLHLPVLEYYASMCWHITEFGLREANTTLAFLAGLGDKGELHSWDIRRNSMSAWLWQRRKYLNTRWIRHDGDTGDPRISIEETDFLFIDTAHTHEHVWNELRLHGRKARRFLGFHDTFSCAIRDKSGPDPDAKGIIFAIEKWLDQFPGEYTTVYKTNHNNGLWILERGKPKRKLLSSTFPS